MITPINQKLMSELMDGRCNPHTEKASEERSTQNKNKNHRGAYLGQVDAVDGTEGLEQLVQIGVAGIGTEVGHADGGHLIAAIIRHRTASLCSPPNAAKRKIRW